MKIKALAISAAIFAAAALNAQLLPARAKSEKVVGYDTIVANVEDVSITRDELARAVAPYIPSLRKASLSAQDFEKKYNEFSSRVLQDMIDRVLIVKYFHDRGMAIPESVIDSALEDDIKTKFNNDRSAFLKHLQTQNKTVKSYRKDLEESIIINVVKRQFLANMSGVSPVMIQEFYEKNKQKWHRPESAKISQITVSADTPEEALAAAKNAVNEISKGMSFEDAAKKFSVDEYAKNGGKAGSAYARGQLQPALDKIVFEAPIGKVNEPVQLSNYAYIIKVEERTAAGTLPIDQVRPEIEAELAAETAKEASQKMV